MTDWNAFTAKASSLISDYSDSELKKCLALLEPQVLDELTLKERMLMRTGVTASKWGRDSCFAKLFYRLFALHPHLFDNAPPQAVNAYNSLVSYLFTKEIAQKFIILQEQLKAKTDELSYEKRLALFLQQAHEFTDLASASITSMDDLKELEKTLEERKAKLLPLQAKRKKLASLVQNLKESPEFVQRLDEWQKLYQTSQITSEKVPQFTDAASFRDWVQTEDQLLQDVFKAAGILTCAKAVNVFIHDFKEHFKNSHLYKAHVAGFLPIVEEAIFANHDEVFIKDLLKTQIQKITEIENFIKQESENFKTKSAKYLQELFSPSLVSFTDLPQEANRILSEQFESTLQYKGELTNELVTEYKNEASSFYEKLLLQMEHLIQAAKERSEKLEEMTQYSKVFFALTAPAKHFKDLGELYHSLEEKVRRLSVSRQDIAKASFSENEDKLKNYYEEFMQLKAAMPKAIDALISEAEDSEQRAEDDKSAIKRRLFEIFWNISPYLDLAENFVDMRKMLTEKLSLGVRKFYAGELSSSELLALCQEMPYEHDVVKIRNEITHRSSRLKDLRDELLRLYREVQETRRFLELANFETQKVYAEILAHQNTIRAILYDVENPFKSFSKANTKDAINYVFRTFWMRVEDVQPQIEHALAESLGLLQKAQNIIKDAFLKALDTLEETISLKQGTRAQLVVRTNNQMTAASSDQLYTLVVSQMHSIEKTYKFAQPFSFFMLISEHKVRLEMMQEAMALDHHIQEVVDFAKAMQYVKTFEEERLDIILEAFERQHLVKDDDKALPALKKAWAIYVERHQRAARLVEDEIFLDIGLLDRHALMDVDQNELNKTLQIAISRANNHIFESRYGLLANLHEQSQSALCKKVYEDLKESLIDWSKVSVDASRTTDWLLEHLRNYCHDLFDAKILLGSEAKMLLPRALAFMNELRCLVGYIETSLQQKRTLHRAQWGPEWISECHAIRALIECYEPQTESSSAFGPLLKNIQAIIAQIPENKELQLAAIQKELEDHLMEIDEIAKDPKKEYPFIYIPGYVAFFDVGGSS